jgi:nitrite reductase/ring-hydroxylating ferredoxin subunit
MTTEPICSIDDIPQNSARGFEIISNEVLTNIVVVNWKSEFFAYRNSCPHTGVTLEWIPNRFFDGENTFLQCSTHGALFRPDDGFCVAGPCVGKSLDKLPITIDKKYVYLNQKN